MNVPTVQYVKTRDGYDIAYTVAGAGRPLIMLPHPGPRSLTWWWTVRQDRLLFQRLAARFRLITYDHRGLGLSGRGLRDDHVDEDFDKDLEALVDTLELDRFVLFGQAAASHTAVRYTLDHPERVEALVFWNVGTRGPAQIGWMPYMHDLAAQNWEFFLDAILRNRYPDIDAGERANLVREAVTQADWLKIIAALDRSNIDPLLSRVEAPTLLMAGRWYSNLSVYGRFLEVMRFMAREMPNARLAVFEEEGGGLMLPESDETPPAILLMEEFLAAIPPPDTTPEAPTPGERRESLSRRELEVLHLLAAGRSNQQIADELIISQNTVRRHVSNIFDKTGVANRAQAAIYARDHGLA